MSEIRITPDAGHHAAAGLTNEALEALLNTALLELAVRTDRDTYEAVLRSAVHDRMAAEDLIEQIRGQRELMRFAAEVQRDIDLLPTVAVDGS